jgi:hypothetical protein
MNKGKNSARADFGPRPRAVTQAQRPKQPNGPCQSARDANTQRAVTALETGAVARLPTVPTWVGGVGSYNSKRARMRWGQEYLTEKALEAVLTVEGWMGR